MTKAANEHLYIMLTSFHLKLSFKHFCYQMQNKFVGNVELPHLVRLGPTNFKRAATNNLKKKNICT